MTDVPLIKQFLQHQSEFMAYLVAMTREFDAAEEVFQNAAVVVMQQADKQDEIRNFRSWAKEIVRRQALYYLRQQVSGRKHVRPVEPSLLEQINRVFIEDTTDEDFLHQEIKALRECVQQVTGVQRTMLTMRYEERASFHTIGESVGKTEGAVQRALSRLRKALHDCVRSKLLLAEGT